VKPIKKLMDRYTNTESLVIDKINELIDVVNFYLTPVKVTPAEALQKLKESMPVEKVCVNCSWLYDPTLPCLSGVYIIYCTISNKCYIGSSLNIKGRVIKHISYLKNKTHHSNKLQRAFDKYKLDSFSYGVLSITDDLRNQEERFIKLFNSYENGYNCTDKCINSKSFKLTKPQIEKAIVKSQKKVVALNFEV
jgi:Uri superfamily endonuclease